MYFPHTVSLILAIPILQCFSFHTNHHQQPFNDDGTEHTHKPILDDEFDAWLAEMGYSWGMKGIAITVTRRNKNCIGWTTETKGYGKADRWGNPVDDETLFAIGSNSKLFTALGIGLLTMNESIPLAWDTKIKDILPKPLWDLQDPIARDRANLVDILSHRSGLPRHELSYSAGDTAEDVVAKLRYLRPSAEFREIAQYNNQMYMMAAHIITQMSGTPFSTYITRNIISPLGMHYTTYNITEAETHGKVADGFLVTGKDEKKGEGRKKIRTKPVPFWSKITNGLDEGPGGVISNAKDMAIWLQMLLLSGKSPDTSIEVIPSSIVERVAQGVTVWEGEASQPGLSPIVYGMGQARYSYQGHELIEHNGGTIGHFSIVTRAPKDGVGISVLINSESGLSLMDMVKWRLLEKSLGLPITDREQRLRERDVAQRGNTTQEVTPSSDGTSSTLPFDDLAGVYFNPGYGTLTLCSYPPSNQIKPPRKECEGVVSEALEPTLGKSPPMLLAAWPKVWLTHVLIYHVSRDQFSVVAASAFPAPFPDMPESDDDSHPFAVLGSKANLRFAFAKYPGGNTTYVEGIAIAGAWGAAPGVKQLDGEGREGAEIWFDRVV